MKDTSNRGIDALASFQIYFFLKGLAECICIYLARRSIFAILPCKANIRTIVGVTQGQ